MYKKIIQILLIVSVLVLLISYWQKDRLPGTEQIDARLYQEPQQAQTNTQPFIEKVGDIDYTITPLQDYDLYGLVVSFHNAGSWWDYYHQEWNDFLNVKDLCVVWGENISSGVYQQMKYESGSWTCYMEFKSGTDRVTWDKFKYSQLSNNHLLAGEGDINRQIMKVRIGDQVHVKGYLAEYERGESFKRGSSTVRTDKGNGACETIYVTDFAIIKKGGEVWWYIWEYLRYLVGVCVVLLIGLMFRGPRGNH